MVQVAWHYGCSLVQSYAQPIGRPPQLNWLEHLEEMGIDDAPVSVQRNWLLEIEKELNDMDDMNEAAWTGDAVWRWYRCMSVESHR